jgi:26S proteasome regulatory subunit N9
MALIESVFKRASDDRVLAFQTIAEETKVPVEEVEFLIMKALSCVASRPCLPSSPFITADDRLSLRIRSLKLIRGSIDAIAQTSTVTWVQPRVLDRGQLEALAGRLAEWCGKVGTVGEVRAAACFCPR